MKKEPNKGRRKGGPILGWLFTLWLAWGAQYGEARAEGPAATASSGLIQELQTKYGQFRAERVVAVPVDPDQGEPRVSEWIITPFGTRILSPNGLDCAGITRYRPDACDFRSFAEVDGNVYLLTVGRVYWYSMAEDEFMFQDGWEYEVLEKLDEGENLFLMSGKRAGVSPLQLLVPKNEVWYTLELPLVTDFGREYTVRQTSDQLVFKFHPGKLVCDLTDLSCVITRRLTPK